MKEKNLERAKTICNHLNILRKRVDAIKNLKGVSIADIKFEYYDTINRRYTTDVVSILNLGHATLKFTLEREMHRSQVRILELEAELRTL